MIRSGSGEPLILLHGVLGSARMWRHVVPLVAAHHDAVALTALGHLGGAAPAERPVSIAMMADDIERQMDELEFETAHIAGNSMGGWLALELATRGRARTVCAFSPGGTGVVGAGHEQTRKRLRRVIADTRRSRALLPAVARVAALRRFGLRQNAVHGDRVTARDFVGLADDVLGCTVAADHLAEAPMSTPIDPPPCPITIAWSRPDRILPLETNGRRAQELVPGATFIVLDDVGHVPMFDDPGLVAATILETTGASARSAVDEAQVG